MWEKNYAGIEENLNHRTIKFPGLPSITGLISSPLKIPEITVDQKLFWKLNLTMFRACGFGYHIEPKVASKDVFKSDDVIGA